MYIYNNLILSAFCVKCQINIFKTTRYFFKNSNISSLTNLQKTVTNKNIYIIDYIDLMKINNLK